MHKKHNYSQNQNAMYFACSIVQIIHNTVLHLVCQVGVFVVEALLAAKANMAEEQTLAAPATIRHDPDTASSVHS